MSGYVIFTKKEPYICKKHGIKIIGGQKCPLCAEEAKHAKDNKKVIKNKHYCKVCGKEIIGRSVMAQKCSDCFKGWARSKKK